MNGSKMTDEPERVETTTPDLAAEKLAALKELFPGAVSDGVLDAARIGELVDLPVAGLKDGRERYGLMWAGKHEAVASLMRPSRGTLVPDLERSVDFENARNVFIEGDNLEVLKILQKAYNDQVKLIYIDPPYNTGNDFVYNDDFTDSLRGYLEYTGQTDAEGKRTSATAETTGRKHSGWLSMMYPRLVLARNLLRRDGAIFVSIDDNEVSTLRLLLDEVFGQENYVNTFVWVSNLKGRQISDEGAVGTKEYVLCYARQIEELPGFRASAANLKALMPTIYKGFNYAVQSDEFGPYVLKNELYNTNSAFNEVTRPNLVFDIYFDPKSGATKTAPVSENHQFPDLEKISPHKNSNGVHRYHAFRWSAKKVEKEFQNLAFVQSASGWRVYTKIRDTDSTAVKDILMDITTSAGSGDIASLGLDPKWFDYPKPVDLIRLLCEVGTAGARDAIVMDFFAGSGTTAHAIAALNAADGGTRRCISVQLQEPLRPASPAGKAGRTALTDVTYERLRRVIEAFGTSDGLRVLSLAESRFESVEYDNDPNQMQISSLPADFVGRQVAQEVLLREGVRLDRPWAAGEVGGAERYAAGGITVVTDANLTQAAVDAAIESNPRVLIFLEDAFAGKDDLKASAYFACKQAGVTMKTV